MKSLSVILADDHSLFLDGLRMTVQDLPGITICAEARNGEVLLQKVRLHKPDIVITDISMPVVDGIQATRVMRSDFPHMGILALSMYTENNLIMEMINAGANGYLTKNADPAEITDAIDAAYMLRPYFCKTSSRQLCKTLAASQSFSFRQQEPLSKKEEEVVRFVCQELTSKEIALQMQVSFRTVESYRARILEKIGVRGTAGIVVFGIKSGIYGGDNN
ncbi:MAG: two component transcriptional regulator, LuxR family [Chitinophagaceae bacterium]|nr:two component transcriptional regulator, LuxR family [Chitinophagaceae bacterium]